MCTQETHEFAVSILIAEDGSHSAGWISQVASGECVSFDDIPYGDIYAAHSQVFDQLAEWWQSITAQGAPDE